jgi:hypothetical protein
LVATSYACAATSSGSFSRSIINATASGLFAMCGVPRGPT